MSCTQCSYHISWIRAYMKRYPRSCSFALNRIKNHCVKNGTLSSFSPFFWSDEQSPGHALATFHGGSRLTYNCSITGRLLSSRSGSGTSDNWAGRPRHLGQVSLIATCNGKWMVRQLHNLELHTLYVCVI